MKKIILTIIAFTISANSYSAICIVEGTKFNINVSNHTYFATFPNGATQHLEFAEMSDNSYSYGNPSRPSVFLGKFKNGKFSFSEDMGGDDVFGTCELTN